MSETYYGPDFNQLQKEDPEIAAVLLSEMERLTDRTSVNRK
jgi:hypothetical protein